MKRVALARLAIAAVSVISKQMLLVRDAEVASNCSRTKSRKRSSPIEAPDRLIDAGLGRARA